MGRKMSLSNRYPPTTHATARALPAAVGRSFTLATLPGLANRVLAILPLHAGVLWRELVAVDTMRLCCVRTRRSCPTKRVGSLTHNFKMLRVPAIALLAQMIHGQSVWNRANERFVGNPMDENSFASGSATGNASLSVAVVVQRSGPAPTIQCVTRRRRPFRKPHVKRHSSNQRHARKIMPFDLARFAALCYDAPGIT